MRPFFASIPIVLSALPLNAQDTASGLHDTSIVIASGLLGATVAALIMYLFWRKQSGIHTNALTRLEAERDLARQELDDFVYTVSHDLKEPLRGISINAEFLSRLDLPEEGKERVGRMGALAKKLERLLTDLLYFSRIGNAPAVVEGIDVGQVISAILDDMSELMRRNNASVVVETSLPRVFAAPEHVVDVFKRLVLNGIQYNDAEKKTVKIGFESNVQVNHRNMQNVFYVQDNGIGILNKDRERVFQIFRRLNAESDYGPGSGASLAIVRRIVETYGGSLDFDSRSGDGTTFYMTLPL